MLLQRHLRTWQLAVVSAKATVFSNQPEALKCVVVGAFQFLTSFELKLQSTFLAWNLAFQVGMSSFSWASACERSGCRSKLVIQPIQNQPNTTMCNLQGNMWHIFNSHVKLWSICGGQLTYQEFDLAFFWCPKNSLAAKIMAHSMLKIDDESMWRIQYSQDSTASHHCLKYDILVPWGFLNGHCTFLGDQRQTWKVNCKPLNLDNNSCGKWMLETSTPNPTIAAGVMGQSYVESTWHDLRWNSSVSLAKGAGQKNKAPCVTYRGYPKWYPKWLWFGPYVFFEVPG